MFLTDLIPGYEGPDAKILGITADSRKVAPGWLFAALPGAKHDGADFILDAIDRGAAAIVAGQGASAPDDVILITVDNPRLMLAALAEAFYEDQPNVIVAVTGTNGKTSTAHFAQQIWAMLDVKAASLGTLGLSAPGLNYESERTTPDTVALHEMLAALAHNGFDHLSMEASSHGLDQYRLDGVRLTAAGFTNLTHDHLDYHKDMQAYHDAKARLFAEVLSPDGVAVLNADVPEFAALKKACGGRFIIDYGRGADTLKVTGMKPVAHGQALTLEAFGTTYDLEVPLVGSFMVMNALCAAGLVMASDEFDASAIIACLEKLQGAPGRLQLVEGHPQGAVYVDYAHTPDALDNILRALRPHTAGKLICLVGCGGDRDRTKRPVMGGIATTLADIAIITDDNPRTEDASAIRKEVMAGAGEGAIEIAGRREAIGRAVAMMGKGDVLVIAGKGHEQGQIIGTRVEPFDDVNEAAKAIEGLKEGKRA